MKEITAWQDDSGVNHDSKEKCIVADKLLRFGKLFDEETPLASTNISIRDEEAEVEFCELIKWLDQCEIELLKVFSDYINDLVSKRIKEIDVHIVEDEI